MKLSALPAALASLLVTPVFAATVTITIDNVTNTYTLGGLTVSGDGSVNISASSGATAPTTFLLSTIVSPAGAGSITGGGSYASGATATVSAVAASGYAFNSWTGCDSSAGATCTVSMTAAKSVTANFSTTTATPPPSDGAACVDTTGLKCVTTNVSAAYFPRTNYSPVPSDTYAYSFTTPSAGSWLGEGVATRIGTNGGKLVVISAQPGDISVAGKDAGCYKAPGESSRVYYAVNQSELRYSRDYTCHLQPGTRYYFNVASRVIGGTTAICRSASDCAFSFTAR